MTMRLGSLFSGIGGFDLGLERAGFEIAWQVENNDYCRRVLRKHWPTVPCHYDITTIDWDYIPRVDLVSGGFPCQPFSQAGKRKGKNDARYLWPEVVRCLDALRPTWFLGENVPGLINLALDQVCADLEGLGYAVWPVCIPACAVDAPHIRQRIWILAYTDCQRQPAIQGGKKSAECNGVGTPGRSSISAHSPSRRLEKRESKPKKERQFSTANKETGRQWLPEPAVGVGDDGLSPKLDGGGLDGQTEESRSSEAMHGMRDGVNQKDDARSAGGQRRFSSSQILQPGLHGQRLCQRCAIAQGYVSLAGKENLWESLRIVWGYDETARAPHRRERAKQLARHHPNFMRQLSQYSPPPCAACWVDDSWEDGVPRVATGVKDRVNRLKGLGNAVVPAIVETIGKMILEVERENLHRM